MNISVFGLGAVGTVTTACLAYQGHNVIGVDVDRPKVDALSSGRSSVREPGVEELLAESHRSGRLSATLSATGAIAESDISLICVNVDTEPNGQQAIAPLEELIGEIGEAIARKGRFHSVVIRSTILPTTTRRRLLPILERTAGPIGTTVGLAHHPEFIREGSAVADFSNAPRTVIGELDARTGGILTELYGPFSQSLYRTTPELSEAVKYADNAWHALKVAFANEIATLCHPDGIDSQALMELFCADNRLNISSAYLKPGFGFGGACLRKDLRAFVHWGEAAGLELPLLSNVDNSNVRHIRRSIDWLLASGRERFAVLGLASKAGTDDLRSSPFLHIVRELRAGGRDVRAFDREVSAGRSAQHRHAGSGNMSLDVPLTEDLPELIAWSDAVVICSHDKEHGSIFPMLRPDQVILDFARILAGDSTAPAYRAFV